MTFFENLCAAVFGPRNPTRCWSVGFEGEIVFDLDQASLNGVRIDDPLDRLSFLGPDEDRKAYKDGELLYPSKGLDISFSDESQKIVSYRIVGNDPLKQHYLSFRGRFLFDGRHVELAKINVHEFKRMFGECYWEDNDEGETILFYEFLGLEWQVEFEPHSYFRCITVTNDPIMANEDQRMAYLVTKPWPPRTTKGK
jgi:hypothetical protein